MPSADPHIEYSGRLELARGDLSRLDRRHRTLGYAKLIVGLATLIVAVWLLKYHPHFIALFLVPAAVYLVLAILHERVIRARQKHSRIIAFYERGLARLDGSWPGTGNTGEQYLQPDHPYARDLDLFGSGSLFELLCTASTPSGAQTLANWLLAPASPEEVLGRQAAVAELRNCLDFRQDLAIAGQGIRSIRPDALAAWGTGEPAIQPGIMRIAAPVLAVLWLAGMLAWGVWGLGDIALFISFVNLGVSYLSRARAERAAALFFAQDQPDAASTDEAADDLKLLAAVLEQVERQTFTSPRLRELQAAFLTEGVVPSRAIARLSRLMEYLDSGHNWILRVLDPFIFWNMQFAFAIEAWRRQFGPAIGRWLTALGEIEALSSLAGYAYENPGDVFPEFDDHAPVFHAKGFTHPLLPRAHAVRNDLTLNQELQLLIISGPNMAGKSTFVRAVGVNAVLAQCGAPVRAQKLMMTPLAVSASICVLDSLQGGVSRFYAEITRLKQIADLAKGPAPVLFLLDELFSGTNSHDRRIGTESMVRNLVGRGAIGMVTTHDLALTQIAESLAPRAANFHFEDHLENGELHFDYRLCPGIVQTSNALQLMRSIGLEV
ncbi:MAG: mismatch repair protein [Candidatus Korobacteraceae bacterium]